MTTPLSRRLRHLPLVAALATAAPLWAQTTSAPARADTPVVNIGDATHSLLQRQREGREASAAPRPIDGRVADLSHQRYLKSFEQPVPAWFGSELKQKK